MALKLTRLPFQVHLSIGVFYLAKWTASRKGIIILSQAAERDCLFDVKVVLIPCWRKGLISPCALKESFRIFLKPHVELEVLGIMRDIE